MLMSYTNETSSRKWNLPEVVEVVKREKERIGKAIADLKATLKDNGIDECGTDRSEEEAALWADLLQVEMDWIQCLEDARELKETPDIEAYLNYVLRLTQRYHVLDHKIYALIFQRQKASQQHCQS